ncbi:hypothetical protein EJB05_50124 [Eragrostis curvula]|uniref:Uncharacterized protein n=1 Tax=Eragrostis curvula TaxID=38414 RepID=A0A5J9SZ23_9POAL|nr:hypothetical protein EJB05_50124 [Eragrostis curvula]
MVEAGASFMDKVEAAMDDDGSVGVSGEVDGEDEEGEMEPVEPLAEPPDDGGPVGWPMPEFCPLTIDGALKESFMETIRKDAAETERPPQEEEEPEPEVLSPDSRPSSSKRHRAGTASPSSKSPYRNILQVFQQCRQDGVGEAQTRNF